MGYADNINVMGRTKRAIYKVYEELKERAKEVGLNINVEKIKTVVENRETRRKRISEVMTINDHDVEVVGSFRWLETVINNS